MRKSEMNINRRNFLKGTSAGLALLATACTLPDEYIAYTENVTAISHLSGEEYWNALKRYFPLKHDRLYLNEGTFGPSPFAVLLAVQKKFLELEEISESDRKIFNVIREKYAEFIGCENEELGFTRNTTESMNIIARGLGLKKGDEVIISDHEHVGGAQPWLALAIQDGVEVTLLKLEKTNDEVIGSLKKMITPRTKVVSLSHVTCSHGMVLPARQIADLCHSQGIIFVLDGAQALGAVPVNLHETGCDFYAASGHKFLLGPKGTGFIYINKNVHDRWKPQFAGAYTDSAYDLKNKSMRFLKEARVVEHGTQSAPMMVGLGAALDFINDIGVEEFLNRSASIGHYLRAGLEKIDSVIIETPNQTSAVSRHITFRSTKSDYKTLQRNLSEKFKIRLRGIYEGDLNALRVTPPVHTNFEELDYFFDAVSQAVNL